MFSDAPVHALVIPEAASLRNLLRTWPGRRKPVLIFGEPGLEKSNIAALVHFGSPAHAAPLVQARSHELAPQRRACQLNSALV